MGYSRKEYPYSGGEQTFAINFALGILDEDDVRLYVLGELDGLGQQVYRDFEFVNAGTVRALDPLPNPTTVVVERTVDKDTLEIGVDNIGGVTRVTLVRAFKQLMMNVHELLDGRVDEFTDIALIQQLVIDARQAVSDAEAALSTATSAVTSSSASASAAAASEAISAANAALTSSDAVDSAASAFSANVSAVSADDDAMSAEAARVLAQAARDVATAARDVAVAARDSATASAGNAASSASSALNSKNLAEQYEADAQTAKTLAEAARDELISQIIPVGMYGDFSHSQAVLGWIFADGTPVTDTYPEYRQLLIDSGSPYGTVNGDPRRPDVRGLVRRGIDAGRGIDPGRTLAYQADAVGPHRHGTVHVANVAPFGTGGGTSDGYATSTGPSIQPLILSSVPVAGHGNVANETRMHNMACYTRIKV